MFGQWFYVMCGIMQSGEERFDSVIATVPQDSPSAGHYVALKKTKELVWLTLAVFDV